MRKFIISESQAEQIIALKRGQKSQKVAPKTVQYFDEPAPEDMQEDYLYHIGRNVDVNNPQPYYSEDRWRKWEGAGHETGSFGSGMYFTDAYPYDNRYNDEKKDAIKKAYVDWRKDGEKFIQIGDGIYRVNTDFFKNLYILKSQGEGEILEELMEKINAFVRSCNYEDYRGTSFGVKRRQRYWLVIQRNAKLLGLRVPWTYREFYNFAYSYIQDTTIKQTPATIFMEMNGFNGVDASRAGRYNSYHQGSVIYDLSKVETEMVPVQGTRDNFRLAHNDLYRTMTDDVLDNKASTSHFRDGKYGTEKDNPEELMKALRRYDMILDHSKFSSLPEEYKSEYLKVMYRNIKNGYISLDPSHGYYPGRKDNLRTIKEYVKDFVRYQAYYFMNINPSITQGILNELSWGYGIKKEVAINFVKSYNGDLSKDFPEDYEEVKEEFGF